MVKMTMSGTVFVSSVNTGHPEPNDRYTETVTLNFAKVKFEYTQQNADQSKGASVNGEFDISKKH
jgi:type VI secretion system secreted protein Hcp